MLKRNKISNKKYMSSLLAASIAAAPLLTGCAPLADPDLASSTDTAGHDQMVGVYITVESDAFWDSWNEHVDKNGKVYAEKTEDTEVSFSTTPILRSSFPIPGYYCYNETQIMTDEDGVSSRYHTNNVSECLWDSSTGTHAYSSGDPFDGSDDSVKEYCSYSADIILHVVPSDFWVSTGASDTIISLHPVYMEPDGDYYMIQGDGYYCGEENGGCTMGTLSLSETWTPDGFDQELTSSFSVTCEYLAKPTQTSVLQYNSNDELLKTDTWTAGEAPSTLKVENETSYLIIKNIGQNEDGSESVKTAISSPENGADTTYVDDLYEAEDGTVWENQIEVSW